MQAAAAASVAPLVGGGGFSSHRRTATKNGASTKQRIAARRSGASSAVVQVSAAGGSSESSQVTRKGGNTTRESRKDGRPVYSPASYQDICFHAYEAVLSGINDGLTLMEVEFPAVPGEDASYKASSDIYIDLNIQYALTVFNKIYKETGKRCEVLVPDGPEYRRAKKVFASSLQLSEGCTLNVLDEKKTDAFSTLMGNLMGGKGLRSGGGGGDSDTDEFTGFNADLYCVVNLSTIELPGVERFVKEKALGKPVIMLNNELDTLRADLGLFSFPDKELHWRFLASIKPVYYLRTRAYSRTINVSPFVINYSGAIFREYPAPWQVMIKQNTGELVCIAEDDDRFTLGEAKEEMLIALGLNDADGSTMKFLRTGYKTNTWWEEEDEKEQSAEWRT
mmetsp:Transcript_10328/g.25319  ORF Transcript_10328/g.25319 Transcript_10328/m.25319 type:complete len:393 (+) Transcript_10328:98-1276(+)|eukprot:CAMPEP_0197591880 /NCGR_PEP_ID=MMETSP1326-20131121/14007_1 /TAXON_ID=1155430 /ORGANISM="Genus nov. species nov., Strain RCC2288" /LENGTH=392 /DNA_ID=CAMNT_0043157455 /DNA_START=91 /DNA_END=1269 /DNA_ORIENTATION=-